MLIKSLIAVLLSLFFYFLGYFQGVNFEIDQKIAQRIKPALVSIVATEKQDKQYLGKGFVVSSHGLVATIYGIAARTEDIGIEFRGGLKYSVEGVVYYNPETDLLLLKTNAFGLSKVGFPESDSLDKGDSVYYFTGSAVEGYSLNTGVILDVFEVEGVRQFKFAALMNPAEKGSPIIDSEGKAAGIVIEVESLDGNRNLAVSFKQIKLNSERAAELDFSEFRKELISRQAAVYFENAKLAYSLGQHQEAVSLIESLLDKKPDSARAYHLLGFFHYQDKNYQKAIDNYKRSLEIDSELTLPYKGLAFAYQAKDQKKEASLFYRKFLEREPQSLLAWHNLSQIYIDLGDRQRAGECYEKILELDSSNIEAHSGLGWIRAVSGNYKKSIYHFKEYIGLRPEDPEGHFKLGLVYHEKGDVKSAKNSFFQAKKLAQEQNETQILNDIREVLTELGE